MTAMTDRGTRANPGTSPNGSIWSDGFGLSLARERVPISEANPYLRSKPNRSAKRAYNRLLNAGSLLWINEALGQDPQRIQQAADAAAAEPDYRKRCRIVREYLPWDEVAELASPQLESGKRALWLRRLQVWRAVVSPSP